VTITLPHPWPGGTNESIKISAMNNHFEGNSQEPFPFGIPVGPEEKSGGPAGSGSRSPLPAGWRRLPTGLRGSRLYHVARPDGTAEYWEGEMPLDHGRVCRRFASELQARAWLHLASSPRFTLGVDDLEEVHESLRAADRYITEV
jgi:hypothetical protein